MTVERSLHEWQHWSMLSSSLGLYSDSLVLHQLEENSVDYLESASLHLPITCDREELTDLASFDDLPPASHTVNVCNRLMLGHVLYHGPGPSLVTGVLLWWSVSLEQSTSSIA